MLRKLLIIAVVGLALVGLGAAPASARTRIAGYHGGIPLGSGPLTVIAQGRCDWLRPHLAAAGLPVETFVAISARESGCAVHGVRHSSRTDLSTSRFGLNFKGRNMQRAWGRLCGVRDWRAPGASVSTDVRCTAAAYRALGLRPWRTR